ncbi:MAG: PQQ-dependent sugar dehydrogenase, partial [Nevskia sp.]|nr:PQQ-dependent sugar dehydrogenase [Nevskia sp.]
YAADCASCHGRRAEGGGNVPALAGGPAQRAADGELFWFVTRGDAASGMPAWNALSEQQRWQIVSFVKTFDGASPVAAVGTSVAEVWQAPPPPMPFTDFRYEAPGRQRRIGVADLPPPFATESARNGPSVVPRPPDAWPRVPEGFEVQLYAEGLRQPRLLRTAPNGDVFVAESAAGQVRVFRGIGADGKAQQTAVFADGLQRPFGIAFYPPGPDPQWVYVGDTDAVLRYPYHSGDLQARGEPQHLAELPHGSGHWTRDLQFSRDGRTLFVAVGSGSNVDDPDTTPAEQLRADILAFTPEGMDRRVYASGIRNPVGLAVNPQTGELWCSVNERDGLGDNLVPDYITHVREGGFYGWPWWYIGAHQDPRHAGKHPELKDRTIVPDVLLQPHSASLEMTFYDGRQLPPEYRGEVFAAEHGSWNKSTRAGYEVIRVPLHGSGHASGEYQDFLTGFVLPSGEVWGRPVGVTVAADGSLLVSDDGSNSIWRVSYKAK